MPTFLEEGPRDAFAVVLDEVLGEDVAVDLTVGAEGAGEGVADVVTVLLVVP